MRDPFRDGQILARWKYGGRACLLVRQPGGDLDGFYEPAKDVAGAEAQPLSPEALTAGVFEMRRALLAARRVIVAAGELAKALNGAAARAGMELEGFADVADPYNRAVANFERTYGRGTPMTEDLTR